MRVNLPIVHKDLNTKGAVIHNPDRLLTRLSGFEVIDPNGFYMQVPDLTGHRYPGRGKGETSEVSLRFDYELGPGFIVHWNAPSRYPEGNEQNCKFFAAFEGHLLEFRYRSDEEEVPCQEPA